MRLLPLLFALGCQNGDPVPPPKTTPGAAEFTARSAPSRVADWEGDWTATIWASDPADPGAIALAAGLGLTPSRWTGRRPPVQAGQLAVVWLPAGADLEAARRALDPAGGPGAPPIGGGAVVVALGPGDAAWRARALDLLPWADLGLVDPVASAALWAADPGLDARAAGAMAAEVLAGAFRGLRYVAAPAGGLPPGLAQRLSGGASATDPDPRVRAEAARAGAALSADPQVAVRLAAAARTPDALAADPEPLVRARAADGSGDPRVLAALAADPSSVVRVIATHKLATLASRGTRDPGLAQALVRAAGSTDAYQRWKAAFGLSYLPEGREVLIRLLREDPDIDVRREAAYALSRHRGPEVREALLAALADSNSFIRRWAAYALGRIEDPTVVPSLQEAVKDPTTLVAAEAAMALERYGVRVQAPDYRGLAEPADLEAAERFARSPDATLRKDLCKGLIRVPGAGPVLMRLARDPDSEVRKAAVEALGWMEDPSIDLTEALRDSDPDTVVAALEAVRQGRHAALDVLIGRLSHADTEIRLRAAEALAAQAARGVAGAAAALQQVLADPDERVRAAAVSVHPAALAPDEPAVLVRRAAAAAGARPDDPDALVRWAAPGADPDGAAWAAGVLSHEDELLHLRFSWNRPEDRPASHRALRPPSARPYGHPNRG